MKVQFYDLLIDFGIPEAYAGIANKGFLLIIALLVSILANFIAISS